MNVLFIALSTSRKQQVARDIAFLLSHAGSATVLTTKGEIWKGLDSSVPVIALAQRESRHWFVRGERILVLRLPALALRALRKAARFATRVPLPPVRRPAGRVDDTLSRMLVAQHEWARRFQKVRFAKFYRNVRPFVLWRVARRDALKTLPIDAFDAVVVADALSTPIGWHLARQHPGLKIGFSLDREALLARGERSVPGVA